MVFALSSQGEKFYRHSTPFLENVDIKRASIAELTYRDYQSTLLPPPYETMCRDYLLQGLISREECFESCLREKSIKRLGKLHYRLHMYSYYQRVEERMSQPYRDYSVSQDYISKNIQDQIDEDCSIICQQKDCNTRIYIPSIRVSDSIGTTSVIGVKLSFNPIIASETIKTISLIQYITDAASTVGFWFGMSMTGFVDIIKSLTIKVIPKSLKKMSQRRRVHHSDQRQEQTPEDVHSTVDNNVTRLEKSIHHHFDIIYNNQFDIVERIKDLESRCHQHQQSS